MIIPSVQKDDKEGQREKQLIYDGTRIYKAELHGKV